MEENKIYDAICAIKYYIELGNGYIDSHEEIPELNPLSFVFDEMEKKIETINQFFPEYDTSQNQLET